MRKVWEILEKVLPQIETGTSLELVVNNQIIFQHNQVWFELYQKYSEWGFLKHPDSNSLTVFNALYTNFVANNKEAFFRMWDALEREYNPINNYDLVEYGANGRKKSEKVNEDTGDNVNGARLGSVTTTQHGSEKDTQTQTGKTQTDRYENAFNSGIDATGTHVAREEVTAPTSIENERTFTNRDAQTDYDKTTGSDSVDGVTLVGYTNTGRAHDHKESHESYNADVQINTHRVLPNGGISAGGLGAQGEFFMEGENSYLSRSGNIGVTSSTELVSREMEMREAYGNLLKRWVHMFILEYCTYVGAEDECNFGYD